jgi:hypothetical protein
MRIIEVGNTYYRQGSENALRTYQVKVGGTWYAVEAASQRGAELQAEKRHEQ